MTLREERPGVWRGDLWHQGRRTKLTFRGSAKEAKAFEARQRLEIEKKGVIKGRDVPTFDEFVTNKYEPMAKLELRATWATATRASPNCTRTFWMGISPRPGTSSPSRPRS